MVGKISASRLPQLAPAQEAWLDQTKVVPAQIAPVPPPTQRRDALPLVQDVVLFP